MDKLAEEIVKRDDQMRSQRSNWNNTWQDCADLVLPQRGAFTANITQGENVHEKVFDTTAIWANEQLAAGLHGFVTPTTQRWLKFELTDAEAMSIDEVRYWLEATADKVYQIIYKPETNFVPMSHEMYLDLGALGTSVMYIEETMNRQSPVRFHTFHLAECCIMENARGQVDTLSRRFKWNSKKIIETFGAKAAGDKVLEAYAKKPQDKFEIVHMVYPATDGLSLSLGMQFLSVYVLVCEKRILSTKRFFEFPYAVGRWSKITSEIYGRSPAMTCLQDIRMINEMSKTTLKAAQKAVDPPLQMPDEGFMMPVKMTPSSINYYEAGRQERIEPIQTGVDVNLGLEMMNQRREQILRSFFLDSMRLQKENVEMTAYETARREEENMRSMSPMVSRIQSEIFDRIIKRVVAICARAQLLPPPPVELMDTDYTIEYLSPVNRALKLSQLSGITRMFDMVLPLAQAKPELLDKLNADQYLDFVADNTDVPSEILHSDKVVAQIRKQRAEQEAKMEQAAMLQSQTESAAKGAQAIESLANARRTE